MVLGNAATAGLVGCQGAPAIVRRRVFGFVNGPDRVPEITPLSLLPTILLRAVPKLGDTKDPPNAQ
jgi:hypothetical protein